MKTPLVIVAASLTAAIILTASLLIATGTRGDGAPANVGSGLLQDNARTNHLQAF